MSEPPMSEPMDLDALNRRFSISGAIGFEASPLGGTVARLKWRGNEATVALQGAQVLGWRHAGTEMLWLSPLARLGTGKAVRGGIPVCWPWFGPHPNDPGKPAHGFVRTRAWQVVGATANDAGVAMTLKTAPGDADRDLFPHEAEAHLTVTLAAGLSLDLSTHNRGPAAFPLSQALHTYFRVSDIAAVRVEGLADRPYIDKLDDQIPRKTQVGPVTFASETDRIYLGDTSAITLAGSKPGGQTLAISSEGSASAVVWNPWVEKMQRLGDMGGPNAYRHMLCIETANAGDDARTLAPGATHVLSARYRPL